MSVLLYRMSMRVRSMLGANLGDRAQRGHLLKIREYRWVLDMNEEIYD